MWNFLRFWIFGPVMGIAFLANAINLPKNIDIIVNEAPTWITDDIPRVIFGFIFLIFLGWIYWPYLMKRIKPHHKDSNKEKIQLEQYKTTSAMESIPFGDGEIKGRWFGNRFVIDEKNQFYCKIDTTTVTSTTSEDGIDPTEFLLPSPPNALIQIRYKIDSKGWANNPTAKIGGSLNSLQELSSSSGIVEIQTDENCVFYFGMERGFWATIYLLGWTVLGQ